VSFRVWIDPGCIQCNWCSDLAPEIFTATPSGSHIRGEVRQDGVTSPNIGERASLRVSLDEQAKEFLEFVIGGCPANVIRLDLNTE
jgi:ferredoxin